MGHALSYDNTQPVKTGLGFKAIVSTLAIGSMIGFVYGGVETYRVMSLRKKAGIPLFGIPDAADKAHASGSGVAANEGDGEADSS